MHAHQNLKMCVFVDTLMDMQYNILETCTFLRMGGRTKWSIEVISSLKMRRILTELVYKEHHRWEFIKESKKKKKKKTHSRTRIISNNKKKNSFISWSKASFLSFFLDCYRFFFLDRFLGWKLFFLFSYNLEGKCNFLYKLPCLLVGWLACFCWLLRLCRFVCWLVGAA